MTDNETNDSMPNAIETSERLTGQVKWFNNRAGFGFITVLDGEKKGEDIFAHHSGVVVNNEQYKYLVQGEYVSFVLRESDNNDHPYQSGDVRGVLSGWLMCETRNANRSTRTDEGEDGRQDEHRNRHDGSERSVRPRGGGPRNGRGGGRDGGRDGGRSARGPPGRQGGTDEWVLTRRQPGNKREQSEQ